MEIIFKNTPIHVEFYGSEGEPLVLLHGFLESSKIWDDFIPVLRRSHRLVVPDLFGHGKTPQHADVHTMEEMAEAVSHILDVANIASAKFIGHSMGGYVSLAFLEKFTDRITGILLLNSSPFADSKERRKERDQVVKVVQNHRAVMIKSGVNRLFSEENRPRFKEKIDALIQEALKMSKESIAASTKGMKQRKDRTSVLKDYTGVKWIFAGEKDTLISCHNLEAVAQETQSGFRGFATGHMSYIEEYEKVLLGVKFFLWGNKQL